MFCTKCGAKLDEGARFCTNCGAEARRPDEGALEGLPADPAPAADETAVIGAVGAAAVDPADVTTLFDAVPVAPLPDETAVIGAVPESVPADKTAVIGADAAKATAGAASAAKDPFEPALVTTEGLDRMAPPEPARFVAPDLKDVASKRHPQPVPDPRPNLQPSFDRQQPGFAQQQTASALQPVPAPQPQPQPVAPPPEPAPAPQPAPAQQPSAGASNATNRLLAGSLIVLVVVVVAAVIVFALGVFGENPLSRAVSGLLGGPAAEAPADDGSAADEPAGSVAGVEPQESLPDYEWNEIARIAWAMEDAASTDAALAIAQEYGLVDETGAIPTAVKPMTLADGTEIGVQLVDVNHDVLANGTGFAALSFVATDAYGSYPMNGDGTNDGGWRESDMRAWLNDSVVSLLPSEVRDNVVAVRKLTNNVGATESLSSVSETADRLWLLSWREMFGNITWNANADTSYIDTVLSGEGSQYAYFAGQGLADAQSSDTRGTLIRYDATHQEDGIVSWWTRSSTPNRSDGFGDVNNGGTDNGGRAAVAQGVVFGFCL